MIVSVCVRYIREFYEKAMPNDIEIDLARQYRQDLLNFFTEKYLYLVDECDTSIIDVDEVKTLYPIVIERLLDEFFENNNSCNYLLQDFMRCRLTTIAKNSWWNQRKTGSVQRLIIKARNGDINAKKELIERYMYIVDTKIQEFGFDNNEEIRQIGYLVLAQTINDYLDNNIENDIVSHVHGYFNRNYFSAVKKMKSDEENYINTKNLLKKKLVPEEVTYELELEKSEILDCINRLDDEKEKKLMIDIFNGYNQSDIAQELGVTSSSISLRVIKARNKVNQMYSDSFESPKQLKKAKKR